MKQNIRSGQAFLITLGLLLAGYITKAISPGVPFGEYSVALTAIYTAYLTKRTVQKLEKFGGAPCAPVEKERDTE